MIKKIFKYNIDVTGEQIVRMPIGAEILSVQAQNDKACLWALVDTTAPCENKIIKVYGTGHTVYGEGDRFIDTFQLLGGSLVFHAFEVVSE